VSDPAAGLPEPERRRSFRIGVWNAALYMGGEGLVDSNTVVPVFLAGLGTSNALIGFSAALPDFGWFLPQFATVPLLSRRSRSIGLYRLAAVLRGLAFALLAVLIVPLASHPTALLAAFLLCYGVYSFSGGVAAVPFMEVVGRTVPRGRLGSFWAQRLFWGGLASVLAGVFVRQLLHGGADAPRPRPVGDRGIEVVAEQPACALVKNHDAVSELEGAHHGLGTVVSLPDLEPGQSVADPDEGDEALELDGGHPESGVQPRPRLLARPVVAPPVRIPAGERR